METTTHNAQKPETADATSDLRDSIRDNADLLETVLAGSVELDRVRVANSGNARIDLKDSAAGVDLKRIRVRLNGGVLFVEHMDDAYATIPHEFLAASLATGVVTIPAGKLTADPPAVSTPTFTNSWADSPGIPVSYYKHLGRVYLAGIAVHASSSASIFTLPSGYRPGQTVRVPVANGTGTGVNTAIISSAGTITLAAASSAVSLDGVSFRAEA